MAYRTSQTDIEAFREDLEANMKFLEQESGNLEKEQDRTFCSKLCSYYNTYEKVSDSQVLYLMKYLRELKNQFS